MRIVRGLNVINAASYKAMSLSSNGGLTANPLDLLQQSKGEMFGAGKRGFAGGQRAEVGLGSIEDMFSGNKASVTTPTSSHSLLEVGVGALFDRNPAEEKAPEAPKKSLLNSMGISFKLPTNVKGMQRDGSKAVRDLGKNETTLNSAKTDMAQQRSEAKARFDGMKNAATALMVNEAIKDGEKPEAYLPKDIDRGSFKAETIASAFVGGKTGMVFAAMSNMGAVTQEVSNPTVDINEKRSKAAQRVMDEMRARASKSDAQKIEAKQRDQVFGGGKQDVAKNDPLKGPKESSLSEAFYESQGYKDLEKCVLDGHDIEEIMEARFEDQPEVMELDQVSNDVDYVLENYDRLKHGIGVVAEAQDAVKERGEIKVQPVAPKPEPVAAANKLDLQIKVDPRLAEKVDLVGIRLNDDWLKEIGLKVEPPRPEPLESQPVPQYAMSAPRVSTPGLIN